MTLPPSTPIPLTAFDGYLDNCQVRWPYLCASKHRPQKMTLFATFSFHASMSGSFYASTLGDTSDMQAVIGSAPNADGNFDRNNNFSAVITDGVSNVSLAMVNEYAGQATYIIPASKCKPSLHNAFAIGNVITACLCPGWSAAILILTPVSYLFCSCPVCPSDSQRPHASTILL